MLIYVASHVHMYIHTCRNACSALLLPRSGKMELQQPCLNNLSTNFHAERSVEGMLYPTHPDKKNSVQQVQCIRLTTANWLYVGTATHLAIAHTQCICMWTVAAAPYACRISFVLLICSQNTSTFTQIHIIWHTWCLLDHTDQNSFPEQCWSTYKADRLNVILISSIKEVLVSPWYCLFLVSTEEHVRTKIKRVISGMCFLGAFSAGLIRWFEDLSCKPRLFHSF